MRLLALILISLLCINCFANEELIENPIEIHLESGCSLNEFCKKIADNLDIENYIKKQIENNYVQVSLDECISVALMNNFEIQIKEHEFKSSKYDYQYNLTKLLPIFNTTSYIAKYDGQILVDGVLSDKFNETALSVNLTLEHNLTNGGEDIFSIKASKYFSKSRKHLLNYTKQEVLYFTSKYYYQMLLAKINIEIYLRNLIERNAQISLAQNQNNSKFENNFNVLRAKVESFDGKTKLLQSLNDFRIAQANLANVMGIDNEVALMPFEDNIVELNLIDFNLKTEEIFKVALLNRQDLKSYNDLINYERQMKNVYLTNFMPKPLVSFQQQFQGTARTSVYPNYIIAGYITWEPGQNLALGTIKKIQEEMEKIKIRKLEYENKYREIKEKIIDSQSKSKFNKEEISVNKKRVDTSDECIKLALKRFENDVGILLDVIQAQNEVTKARIAYVSSIVNYNLSQIELVFNCGTLTKEKIIENYKP